MNKYWLSPMIFLIEDG